ncbi:pectate lyase [uncultured Arcticibacterium sp.]|uniref:pectate lyase family protein n=1 Tax=uncultured Arcticibacterium sp. TaxID=2173042 RepID=UPI0030FC3193
MKYILLLTAFLLSKCEETTIYGSKDLDIAPEKPSSIKQSQDELLAFPSAEGFGQDATGGRGGKVLFVTNLNDSGTGSFRWAVQQSGARYILFKVSGTIALKSKLVVSNGDLTIAGQSAPGDGICIKDYPVVLDADNIIIRFMRFRLGDAAAQQADGLEARFHKNIMIDHCSISWSSDETATFYQNENTTLQWCMISESLTNSVHEKGSHGYGGIWGGKKATFHHNLFAHHQSRTPRFGERANEAFALTDLVDMRNNVIYNWGANGCYGGEAMNVNMVNNYYKPGPATPNSKKERIVSIDKNLSPEAAVYNIWGKYYIAGNKVEGSQRATDDNWTYGVKNQFHSKYGVITDAILNIIKISQPHDIFDNVTTHSADEAYLKVLAACGASYKLDAVDKRILEEVANTTFTFKGSNGSENGIIDSQEDVGGFPVLNQTESPIDSSEDGMPDEWKKLKGLDISKDQSTGRQLSTAYDNVEVYLNELVKEIVEKQI